MGITLTGGAIPETLASWADELCIDPGIDIDLYTQDDYCLRVVSSTASTHLSRMGITLTGGAIPETLASWADEV